tara:strand:- start:32 stop:409 length:378 start_codon:yes stop_codon:yes gene_type:complete
MNLIERALEIIKEAPLTPMQRRKKAIIMKRLAPKIARKRKIAMRKKAGIEKIQGRANKAAREYMRQLFLKGKKYTDLPLQARVNIDKKVEKKKTLMQKLAKRMIPVMRRKEIERLKQLRKSKTDK